MLSLVRCCSVMSSCTQRCIFFHQVKSLWVTRGNPNQNICCSSKPIRQHLVTEAKFSSHDNVSSSSSISNENPLSELENAFMGYIFGKKRATEVAHQVWKHIVHKGDTVIDATCGNGFDTLAMLKLITDQSGTGRVYGMDIQKDALENTYSLLDKSTNQDEKELVKLFDICHSRMEEVVPKGTFARLVVFNLGYLPGGDKAITTVSGSTILALEAAKNILSIGGLISILVYVGHPGGREEYEAIQDYASKLPVKNWVCCKLEMLNRPLAPVLIFIFKK